jgi:hypothetical protein
MSEKENVKLVETASEDLETGSIEAMLKSFAEDVVWQIPEMENLLFAGIWQANAIQREPDARTRLRSILRRLLKPLA